MSLSIYKNLSYWFGMFIIALISVGVLFLSVQMSSQDKTTMVDESLYNASEQLVEQSTPILLRIVLGVSLFLISFIAGSYFLYIITKNEALPVIIRRSR